MKIAIASDGKSVDSVVSENGGRAKFYLIFEDGKLIETIKNPFLSGRGAGWSVAYMLAEKGVKKFISARVGERMLEALKEKGIEYIEAHDKRILDLI